MSSILILTASFGEGHNAAARNVRDAIQKLAPDQPVVMHDVFAEAYGFLNRLTQQSYLGMIHYAPWLWRIAFTILDRSRLVQSQIRILRRAVERLRDLIDRLQPRVVVVTFPGYNHLLDHLYQDSSRRPFEQITIVTDSLTINSIWYRAFSTWYLVPNEATAAVLHAAGIEDRRMVVSGFPVPGAFAELASKEKERPMPPWEVLMMIHSARRSALKTIDGLLDLDEIRLTVTVGRGEELVPAIREIAGRKGRSIGLYGWTREMPQLLAKSHLLISKAGGATVQESLAARTPLVITEVIPGQEEGNARLVEDSGAGVIAKDSDAVIAAVRFAFLRGGALWERWYQAASALSRPNAAFDIARFLLERS